MRSLFKYTMLTVGFRYGAYAAGYSLLAALMLYSFSFDPMGQFRLFLGLVTLVIMVLAIKRYKYIYNQGNMNVTHGFAVSLAVGLVSGFLYSLALLIWVSISERVWDLHVADMIRTFELQKEGFVKYYSMEAYNDQLQAIIESGLEKRKESKVYFALITFRDRVLLALFFGFLTSIYYRN
ncbi:MAG: DUF4199 domain-containing protein [Bacteroidia bacterium]